jgi:uncharacterized membrane protein
MRKLSTWAKFHPYAARVIIVFCHIILTLIGIYFAEIFRTAGVIIPQVAAYLLVAVFTYAAITYPARQKNGSENYHRRKLRDFLLVSSSFGMIIFYAANGLPAGIDSIPAQATAIIGKEQPTAESILRSLENRDRKHLTKNEKRILRKEFKKQLKVYATATLKGDKEKRDNTGLIILAIIGALGLLFLLTAIACSISCGGAEGAALIIFILGLAGIVFGFIAVMKSIKRKSKKPAEPKPDHST